MALMRVFRGALTVVWFLVLLVTWALAWVIQTITIGVMLPFSTKTQRQDVCGKIFRGLNMLAMDYLNPFWSNKNLRAFRPESLPKGRPVIFMINHLSNSDPFTCIRFMWPIDCKWICKGSLFSVPFGGWCLTNNGDLAVRFTKEKGGWGTEKGSVKSLMDDAADLLRRGQPIAVFPEGVRNSNPDGPLQEFKVGFFDLAIRENAIIVPIAISGTERHWPKHDWMFNFSTGYGSVGDYIDSAGLTTEQIVAKTRDAIDALRSQHPDRKALAARQQKQN